MPNRKTYHYLRFTASALLLAGLLSVRAADYTWGGGDLPYSDTSGTGWGGGPPDLNVGDTATIGAGTVSFIPGGDFSISGNGSLTMNGGYFSQTSGNNWMNLGNQNGVGTLTVNSGATFNMGTSARMRLGDWGTDSLLRVDGGTFDSDGALIQVGQSNSNNAAMRISGNATVNLAAVELYNLLEANGGNLSYSSLSFQGSKGGTFSIGGSGVNGTGDLSVGSGYTFSMDSGSLSLTGQFQATGGVSSISGGTLNTSLISISGDVVDFSGGIINLDGTSSEGITAGAGDFLNFTTGSLGTLFVDNLDLTGLNTLLSDGRVRFNGTTNQAQFATSLQGNGYSVSVIPEPSTLMLMALSLLPALFLYRRRVSMR